jgi:hypothetical protein
MTEEFRCENCDRSFKDEEGFNMHNSAKHPNLEKKMAKINYKKIRNWSIFIIISVLVVIGIYMLIQSGTPEGEDFSKSIPILKDSEHVPVGSDLISYNSNPPTSGSHYGTPARAGFRENPIEDSYLVHSLEHGLILVSYHTRIGEEAEKLKDIVNSFTVVVQRDANDADIALAAWGRLDTFNLEDGTIDDDDLQRISDFVQRYANKAPEKIPAGQHGGV